MENYKLKKDYLYCDGYFRKKSVEDAIEIVDEMLIGLIRSWNESRRETSFQEDDAVHEKIDALRDLLFYLTGKEEYNNDLEVRQRLHENYYFWLNDEATTEDEFNKLREEEKEKESSLERKLHKKKLKLRRSGRLIMKERLYGEWALAYM